MINLIDLVFKTLVNNQGFFVPELNRFTFGNIFRAFFRIRTLFISASGEDEFDGFSSDQGGPPFPEEDYLMNAPEGFQFPFDLSGGKGVISIEPNPDNNPDPFLLKPLVGDIPADAEVHVTYTMNQNLNFPTGTAKR